MIFTVQGLLQINIRLDKDDSMKKIGLLFSMLSKDKEAVVSLSLLILLMMVINGLISYFVWAKYSIMLS